MERISDTITVYKEKEAKLLFKILRKKGFIVDKGRGTGNIYSAGRKTKLAWMIRDLVRGDKGTWIIELLFKPIVNHT
jgi:uncharacterized phage-like protein YoqJ